MKEKLRKYGGSLGLCGVLGAELTLLTDAAVVLGGGMTSLLAAAGIWLALTIGCGILLRWKAQRIGALVLAIPLVLGSLGAAGYGCWLGFNRDSAYEFPDAGKKQIFGERRVLLIVPHQDDELNVLGGVMEEYVRYGSALYPVFVTNGDYKVPAQTRYQEALAVFRQLGVPEEQVVFLGYGDDWNREGPHLYNGESGVVMESHAGKTAVYGTQEHPAYREGRAYTIDNLMEDMKSVILEVRPDVIFCSDYDDHIDHKATTLLFEKVMGRILKEQPDYRPVVYKAYAYSTAWTAEPDYYADNVLSTRNPFEEPMSQRPAVYRWEDRVRFPVDGTSLSRALVGSGGYEMLSLHQSQTAHLNASAVVNGDKVAWRRDTASLCLRATVEVSSGDGALLHDFMLLESRDLRDERRRPYDGVWIPEEEGRLAHVVLEAPSAVREIVLYDHPDPAQNVRNAVITFDDGTSVETGPLDPGGAATRVPVEKEAVSAFTVQLTHVEGEKAGLTELEALAEPTRTDGRFLKLTDGEGNFLYDYLTTSDGLAELSLYSHGDLPEFSDSDYSVNTDREDCPALVENGIIRVRCPVGEQLVLNVTCHPAGVSDSIVIRNPGRLVRLWGAFWQNVEETVFGWYSQSLQNRLLIPTTVEKISYVLRHL